MRALGPALLVIPLIAVIESLENVTGLDRKVRWARLAMRSVREKGTRLIGDGSLMVWN